MNSALTIDTSIHESPNFITPMIMVRGVEKTYPNGLHFYPDSTMESL